MKRTVRKPPIPTKLNLGNFVLEIGVGEGRVLRHVFTVFKPRLYVGLDISLDILYYLKKQNIYVELLQADGLYLPFRNEAFTCVLCIATSHYIPDKMRLFSEIYRVLKRGGVFLSDFKNLSQARIALHYALRNVFNNLLRCVLCRKLLYYPCCIIVELLNKLGLKRYGFDPEWFKSIFTYGITPYYPIRREDCINMLMKIGFTVKWITDENDAFVILGIRGRSR